MRSVAERMPLVVVKGGASEVGARAAASHTGSLATDDRVFDGACRQAGVVRAATIEEAYEAAATFATQPLPKGPNVCVVSTAGGWGVVTADAISRTRGLSLLPLPDDLKEELDRHLPPRWSRNNPVDMAGGETKDTIPTVLEIAARHPAVDAVVFLGMGIQGNEGRMEQEGPLLPGPRPRAHRGLSRAPRPSVHRDRGGAVDGGRQADPHRHRAAPSPTATTPRSAGCRDSGQLCYGSANRAVTALGHLWQYAQLPATTIRLTAGLTALDGARHRARGRDDRGRRRSPCRRERAPARGRDTGVRTARHARAVRPPRARVDRRAGGGPATRRAPQRSRRAARPGSSCLTVAVDGHVVFSSNATTPLIPASVQKLCDRATPRCRRSVRARC